MEMLKRPNAEVTFAFLATFARAWKARSGELGTKFKDWFRAEDAKDAKEGVESVKS